MSHDWNNEHVTPVHQPHQSLCQHIPQIIPLTTVVLGLWAYEGYSTFQMFVNMLILSFRMIVIQKNLFRGQVNQSQILQALESHTPPLDFSAFTHSYFYQTASKCPATV